MASPEQIADANKEANNKMEKIIKAITEFKSKVEGWLKIANEVIADAKNKTKVYVEMKLQWLQDKIDQAQAAVDKWVDEQMKKLQKWLDKVFASIDRLLRRAIAELLLALAQLAGAPVNDKMIDAATDALPQIIKAPKLPKPPIPKFDIKLMDMVPPVWDLVPNLNDMVPTSAITAIIPDTKSLGVNFNFPSPMKLAEQASQMTS